jgi:hypothetical protein
MKEAAMVRDRRGARERGSGRVGRCRTLAAALAGVVTAVAVLPACSSGSGTPSPADSEDQVWLAITHCIRTHGMPQWPDPVTGPDGHLMFPADAPHTTAQVQAACRSLFAQLPADAGATPPPSAADLTKLREFAVCMRRNGVPDWPDPDASGNFVNVPAAVDVGTLLKNLPAPCRADMPSGGLHVRDSHAGG